VIADSYTRHRWWALGSDVETGIGLIERAKEAAASRFKLMAAGGQIGLNAHVRDAAPDSAGKTAPGRCLAMQTFRPPTMPLIQPLILVAPSVTASSSPEQSGIVVADHDCFVPSPFRQAVAFY
jgi:hypothetical protein